MVFKALILLVALQHIAFCVLEMFFWTKPLGKSVFKLTDEFATATANLAANQGLYNAFLAAGLIWSLMVKDTSKSSEIAIFFLGCVAVAGVYGGYSVGMKILLIQGVPALLILFWFIFKK